MFHAKAFNEDGSENKKYMQESDQRIINGINNIIDQISQKKEQKLGKYTNGLGGLF